MRHFLRSLVRRSWGGLGLCLLLPALGQAQCPTAASCTPGRASNPQAAAFNMGILNVTVGAINNTTVGQADGYRDYSCAQNAALTMGAQYTLSVRTNAATPENVRAWVDYNNDGTFGAGELVLSSDNAAQHSGTFTPPTTAVLGQRLRLRVAADYANAPTPTPCSTPQYSQDEDYAVTLSANMSPPVAAFTQNLTTTCSGCVQFTDQSQNLPSGWLWNFGDNTTSTQQNPQHCYAAPGTYQVTLTATNAAGSNASAARAITYTNLVPPAAACTPATANYCCNYGLTRVQLGTIDNASADGSAGYEDFSCPQRTDLTVGLPAALALTTGGTNQHDTRVYLDLNNDGALTAGELVFEALNQRNPSGSLTLPGTATLNQPLRLRIVTDFVGSNPQPCTARTNGQAEDYTVIVRPNVQPPMVAFTSNYVPGNCVNPVQFTDQTLNAPTAWLWSFSPSAGVTFVNGTSATSQNPTVQFANSGTYSVSLTATNANGSATSTQANYLSVQVPCLTYCASNGGSAAPPQPSQFWITSVALSAAPNPGGAPFAAFLNTSGNSAAGYGNYTAQTATLRAGNTHTLTVGTNLNFSHRTSVWLDYNRDGVFANTTGATGELVYNGLVGGQAATATFVVPNNATVAGQTRMRVTVTLTNNAPNACAVNQGNAEVEDYTVNVLAPLAARREADLLPALAVSPNPTADGRLLLHVLEAGASGRYAVAVENLLGARLREAAVALAPNAPAQLDLSALPAGVYLLRLTNARGETALRRVVRE